MWIFGTLKGGKIALTSSFFVCLFCFSKGESKIISKELRQEWEEQEILGNRIRHEKAISAKEKTNWWRKQRDHTRSARWLTFAARSFTWSQSAQKCHCLRQRSIFQAHGKFWRWVVNMMERAQWGEELSQGVLQDDCWRQASAGQRMGRVGLS